MGLLNLLLLLALQADPEPPRVLWTIDLDAPSFGSGAIGDLDGDGRPEVAFGTYFGDARLRVVRGATGEVIFERPSAGGPFDASCFIADRAVVIADSAYGTVFAYDAAGEERWRLALPSGTDSPVAFDGRRFYVGTMKVRGGSGRLVCLDAETRRTLWEAELEGHVQTGPVIHGDAVYAGTWHGDGHLHAFDARTGARRWSYDVGGNQYHGPAIAEWGIVTTGLENHLVCLDFDGTLRWEKRIEGDYLFAPTLVLGDRVAVFGRRAYLFDRDGNELWRRDLPGSCARGAAPVDLDGDGAEDLLLGAGAQLIALRARDGHELWRFDARAGESPYEDIDNAVLVADLTGDGQLEAFFVSGAGTSENDGRDNYGRAYALTLPGVRGPEWRHFRGSLRHVGSSAERE